MPDIKGQTYSWNGWEIVVSADGTTVSGRKADPEGGDDLTVRTSVGPEGPAEIALVAAASAMADEDARTADAHEKAAYWAAYHRLYRQQVKKARGDKLAPEELAARERYQETIAEHSSLRGDALPVTLEGVD